MNGVHSQGPVGDFEGLLVLTWGPKEKTYKQWVFGSDSPGAVAETGQLEGEVLVFRGEFSAGGTKIGLRNSTRVVARGTLIRDEYISTMARRKRCW